MGKTKTLPWDVIDHWETDQDILSFLKVVLEEGDGDLLALALVDVARAKGVLEELQEQLQLQIEAAAPTTWQRRSPGRVAGGDGEAGSRPKARGVRRRAR